MYVIEELTIEITGAEKKQVVMASDDINEVLRYWNSYASGQNDVDPADNESIPFCSQNFSAAHYYRIVDVNEWYEIALSYDRDDGVRIETYYALDKIDAFDRFLALKETAREHVKNENAAKNTTRATDDMVVELLLMHDYEIHDYIKEYHCGIYDGELREGTERLY